MNKQQLIEAVAATSGLSRAETKRALEAMITISKKTLQQGESIRIREVGTLSVVDRASRMGRNPQTGMSLRIPARKVVRYKANCPGPHIL